MNIKSIVSHSRIHRPFIKSIPFSDYVISMLWKQIFFVSILMKFVRGIFMARFISINKNEYSFSLMLMLWRKRSNNGNWSIRYAMCAASIRAGMNTGSKLGRLLCTRLANWTLRNFTLSNYCSVLASVIAPCCIRALFAAHDFDSQIKPFSLARRILIYSRRRVRSHARSQWAHRMDSKKLINFTNVTT